MTELTDFQQKILNSVSNIDIRCNELMARHTSFRIGGAAEVMAFPKTEKELAQLLRTAAALQAKPAILGAGTNVLAPDEDYETSKDVEPLVINQGFRSYQVMLAMEQAGLKPSRTSNHMTGCAVDIRCMGVEHAVHLMDTVIRIADQKKQDFDELFLEKRGSVYWIHFAVRPEDNRRKISFFMN